MNSSGFCSFILRFISIAFELEKSKLPGFKMHDNLSNPDN